jgi:hypothetical protein
MAGFTARIYDIVRNVVIPATTSVLTLVLFCDNLKIFSSISKNLFLYFATPLSYEESMNIIILPCSKRIAIGQDNKLALFPRASVVFSD